MGTKKTELETSINDALTELEKLGEEIKLKLHLAEMEAMTEWNEKLEPRLFQARVHAGEAKEASKRAIDETIKAFRQFAAQV